MRGKSRKGSQQIEGINANKQMRLPCREGNCLGILVFSLINLEVIFRVSVMRPSLANDVYWVGVIVVVVVCYKD